MAGRRAARRTKRQDSRIAMREAKKMGKIDRKQQRVDNKSQKIANRQERKIMTRQNRADKQSAKSNQRLAQIEAEAQNLPQDMTESPMPTETKVKAINYLKKRGRVIEDENDGAMLGAQFVEERGRHIAQKHDEIEEEIDNDESYTDEERDSMIPEYEDIEEAILEEEANEFSFTGDADNFLDPQTIATLATYGKVGLDGFRQKRFESGKKAFGMSKKQWEAKQALKNAGGGIGDEIGAASDAIKKKGITDAKTKATPYIIGGILVLTLIGIAVYQAGKKS
jgi:hypothetical protein